MIPAYFCRTPVDDKFWEEKLKPRMPQKLLDVHCHIAKQEFHANVDPYQIEMDWAAQCSGQLCYEEMKQVCATMFPDTVYEYGALGTVTKGADFVGTNNYLAQLLREKKIRFAMMTLDPFISDAETERILVEGGFAGYKPYPDMVSGQKGADIGMFDFIPHGKLKILNKYKKGMTLHIPRAGRLPDPKNVDEIKRIVDMYPDVKLIIAHYGRAYTASVFERGAKALGEYMKALYFDMGAVLNPEVLRMSMDVMDRKHIMWATDLPVFQFHGRRRWTEDMYVNLCREDFPWNKHLESPEVEAEYTFFLYEQMNNVLNVVEEVGDDDLKQDVFWRNAERILTAATKGEDL